VLEVEVVDSSAKCGSSERAVRELLWGSTYYIAPQSEALIYHFKGAFLL
jgi:hypothetical protein